MARGDCTTTLPTPYNPAMSTPVVTAAIIDAIKAAGYHVGWTTTVDLQTRELQRVVNAVDARTGESWTVRAPSEYEAAFELARQVGFDFEDC